jgi:hypothetical protein
VWPSLLCENEGNWENDDFPLKSRPLPDLCDGIFKQSMGARKQVGIGLSYRPAISLESTFGLLKSLKIRGLASAISIMTQRANCGKKRKLRSFPGKPQSFPQVRSRYNKNISPGSGSGRTRIQNFISMWIRITDPSLPSHYNFSSFQIIFLYLQKFVRLPFSKGKGFLPDLVHHAFQFHYFARCSV